ncbi:MAG TPA: decaprenyl-phosphate phosphoribosyltransferase [Polyangiaceae bacterium]|nr:decaprenyl-phosphate phosphoribosyltransferase [Polyangiaceae bacterium]
MPSAHRAPDSDAQPSTDTPEPSTASPVALASMPPGPLRLVRGIVRTVRPHQWMKNVFVLAPLVFAKELFDWELLVRGGGAFFVFCLLAGAVYTINDIVDAPADRVHPVKRHRPIAAGVVPIQVAKVLAFVLFAVAMAGALYGPPLFALVGFLYFVQNIAYSLRLKRIAYADVGCIALGFVLRVVAGGLATRIPVSGYLLACTALLALFLGFGKRSHELAGVSSAASRKQRAALESYTSRALGRALAVTGVASIVTYVAYTIDPSTREMFHSNWLWLTAINPIYGILRFVHLVRTRPKAESPTQEMLRDTPFMLNLLLWIIVVVVIVYRLRPSAAI